MSQKLEAFKALSAKDKKNAVVNWMLDHAMIIIIVLLAFYVQLMKPAFFSVPSLVNIVSLTAARLPMALGVAGCIVLAGTDLSGGRIAGMTAYIAAILLQKVGANGKILENVGPQPLILVIVLVMIVGALVGMINGYCMGKFKLHPFIVTLATQMMTYGAYLTISNSKQVSSLDASYTTSFVTRPLFKIGPTSVMTYVLLAAILTAIMWVVWNKTTFGKNMFAVGSNEEAARVSGVNVLATIVGTFMIAGALYGYTGFVEAARLGASTATLGLNYESDAIAAVVIGGVSFVGGTGKISGVILGVFMMQLIMSGMTFLGISGNVTYIIKGAVILFACILDMRKYRTKTYSFAFPGPLRIVAAGLFHHEKESVPWRIPKRRSPYKLRKSLRMSSRRKRPTGSRICTTRWMCRSRCSTRLWSSWVR